MIGFHLILRDSPTKLGIFCPRQNKTVENDIRVGKSAFDIFDALVELHLLTRWAFVEQPVRLNEGDILFAINNHPQNKVGMEITRFKKAHAFSATQVPEQKEFCPVLLKLLRIGFGPIFKIRHKLKFTFVQRYWQNGNFPAFSYMEERLVKMHSKATG